MQMSVRRRFRMRLAWAIAAIGVLASVYLGFCILRSPADRPVVRFTLSMEQGIKNISWPRISPDGRMVAFHADDSIVMITSGSGRSIHSKRIRCLAPRVPIVTTGRR